MVQTGWIQAIRWKRYTVVVLDTSVSLPWKTSQKESKPDKIRPVIKDSCLSSGLPFFRFIFTSSDSWDPGHETEVWSFLMRVEIVLGFLRDGINLDWMWPSAGEIPLLGRIGARFLLHFLLSFELRKTDLTPNLPLHCCGVRKILAAQRL